MHARRRAGPAQACARSLTLSSRRGYTLGFPGTASHGFTTTTAPRGAPARRCRPALALAVGLLAYFLSAHVAPAAVDHRQQRALQAQVDDLKQQVANLQRAAQVNDVATGALRGTLTQREKELSALRADLGFYSRLVGGDGQRQGLKLQEVKLQPITGSRG